MKRRDFLRTSGIAALGISTFPLGWTAAADKKTKILYFTRSAGYEHSVVRRKNGELAHSEKILAELGRQHGFEVVCTKDGTVFDGDLEQYDVIAFYTSGDLCRPNKRKTPPMSPQGKQKLLDAIAAGKGFVGFHSASDSFHSPGPRKENQDPAKRDPYIAMIGGEFITHGRQQKATMRVCSPHFPGTEGLGKSFELLEEWYALKNFAPDLHVILLQETKGMDGAMYQRPPFPSTWARLHNKGRVFYTAMGHREDIWTNPLCQQIILGGLSWAAGNVKANVEPNLDKIAPGASQLGE
ncbi:MAG: ThuA domain-containing protein [Planctomycetes bacterium]|nr:ThuA domain-containing protein [Planctomycetota bacterium]